MEEKEEKEKRRKNNAKFSGHYVRPRTHNMRAHALRSHKKVFITWLPSKYTYPGYSPWLSHHFKDLTFLGPLLQRLTIEFEI